MHNVDTKVILKMASKGSRMTGHLRSEGYRSALNFSYTKTKFIKVVVVGFIKSDLLLRVGIMN